MAKRISKSVRRTEPDGTRDVDRRFGSEVVPVDRIYRVPALRPAGEGPWTREADKIAWVDAATGLGCIIRRAEWGGNLCGYVAVGPGHPLFGYQAAAAANVGIRVHGGIDYAKACDDGPENISVCHVPSLSDVSGQLWWLGFSCDKPYDHMPRQPAGTGQHAGLAGVVEREYRDEAYVFGQCTALAAQLAAIGEGRSPSDAGPSTCPPVGMDPSRTER